MNQKRKSLEFLKFDENELKTKAELKGGNCSYCFVVLLKNNKKVVVKFPKFSDICSQKDFQREYWMSKLYSSLNIPGIAKIIGKTNNDNNKFSDDQNLKTEGLVFEYVEGMTLEKYMQQVRTESKHLCINEIKSLCYMILQPLASLHAYGFGHGDLHSRNVILTTKESIIISATWFDFGKAFESNQCVPKCEVDVQCFKSLFLHEFWLPFCKGPHCSKCKTSSKFFQDVNRSSTLDDLLNAFESPQQLNYGSQENSYYVRENMMSKGNCLKEKIQNLDLNTHGNTVEKKKI